MLVILTTHPIQYQVPIWQALARDGRVPFEVWYLTRHGTEPSVDRQFGKTFAWDIDMTAGYPHRFIDTGPDARPDTFWACRLREPLRESLRAAGAKALWIQGWQTAAYWQAVREAKAAGVDLWLRAESNDLAPVPLWKQPVKRLLLKWFFERVDRFLCIGAANRRLYQSYGVGQERLYSAPYAVDNARFSHQAKMLRADRAELRRQWGIGEDAFCVLFCGKFISKKRPMDVAHAAARLRADGRMPGIHLLFVGSGELGPELRNACDVVFDADAPDARSEASEKGRRPPATFAGFLNQTEISRAYVAADCLVLPSDAGETWGLVVNEAMASGTPAIASNLCGCAEDMLSFDSEQRTFDAGDIEQLAQALVALRERSPTADDLESIIARHDFSATVATVGDIYSSLGSTVLANAE